jgi:WS/DGAT/MGAT family acyltransferase
MGQPLSETEILLWNLGRDPNLASTMGLVAILDGRPEPDRLRTTLANTVATVDRLRQRVVGPPARNAGLGRPEWRTDPWFDLDHHVRVVGLTGPTGRGPGRLADLRHLAAQLINDPFDETRPLWQFHLVTGLRGGHSALVGKVHHSISDGIGLLRLAGSLLEFEPDTAAPEPVDLAAVLAGETGGHTDNADDGANGTNGESGDGDGGGPGGRLRHLLGQATRIPGPVKVLETGAELLASAKAVTDQLPRSNASPLWATRSRNRRLELVAIPLDGIRATATERGVTINDLFVAACAQAAVHYHREMGAELPRITATVVVSTGSSSPDDPLGAGGDNSFIPVPIGLPGDGAGADDRLDAVHEGVRERRQALGNRPDLLSSLGAIGGLVPSSVAAALALDQAARVDFATSNLPGPPVPTWLAGRPVRRIHPVGPVAGTAFNVTFMSYDDQALMGLHIDPAAVSEPSLLAQSLSRGFGDFGVRRR